VHLPDVLLQPHSAPLQLEFYTATRFPEAYRGDIFLSSHGSWNRSVRTGYAVLRIHAPRAGIAGAGYEEFITGFVRPDGRVWGRPVGIAVAADGALLVSDDASGVIWRVDTARP
jgi:glucose/arabinose dehydrogenase